MLIDALEKGPVLKFNIQMMETNYASKFTIECNLEQTNGHIL
jgi:hypothetical protein